MIQGFVYGVFSAWFLQLFKVGDIVIRVVQDFVPNIELSLDHYYVLFGIIGIFSSFFQKKESTEKDFE